MVLAGTGKEGKTKEVVKDREGKTVGIAKLVKEASSIMVNHIE